MKNFILKAIAYICLILFITAGCFLDSDSWIPTGVLIVTGGWLVLFGYANNWFEGEIRDGEQ